MPCGKSLGEPTIAKPVCIDCQYAIAFWGSWKYIKRHFLACYFFLFLFPLLRLLLSTITYNNPLLLLNLELDELVCINKLDFNHF
jgi:hypothetical protein